MGFCLFLILTISQDYLCVKSVVCSDVKFTFKATFKSLFLVLWHLTLQF